jgi:hypothetical protein
MTPQPDEASETANAWLRSGRKTRVTINDGKRAAAEVSKTPEELAAAGGADGGARGPAPRPDPVERFNKAIRDWADRGRL